MTATDIAALIILAVAFYGVGFAAGNMWGRSRRRLREAELLRGFKADMRTLTDPDKR